MGQPEKSLRSVVRRLQDESDDQQDQDKLLSKKASKIQMSSNKHPELGSTNYSESKLDESDPEIQEIEQVLMEEEEASHSQRRSGFSSEEENNVSELKDHLYESSMEYKPGTGFGNSLQQRVEGHKNEFVEKVRKLIQAGEAEKRRNGDKESEEQSN